jgi:hypothetical protein
MEEHVGGANAVQQVDANRRRENRSVDDRKGLSYTSKNMLCFTVRKAA